MIKKQEHKTTKSIQFDSKYNEKVIQPFLQKKRMTFSFYARELVMEDIEKTEKNYDKRSA